MIAIEKKSTGGTLLSLLDEIRTAKLIDIPRTREQGNKTKRFLEAQPYLAERRVSLPTLGRHVKLCLDHMSKITANETHRWDDIADTCADAIKIALIDKGLILSQSNIVNYNEVARSLTSTSNQVNRLRKNAYTR
jgi:hypothetical protein